MRSETLPEPVTSLGVSEEDGSKGKGVVPSRGQILVKKSRISTHSLDDPPGSVKDLELSASENKPDSDAPQISSGI